jgi:hypothetical protein
MEFSNEASRKEPITLGEVLMKPRIRKKDLLHKEDIWNTVISVLCEYDYSTENRQVKEAYTVFQYYSELESGGHESLLNWTSDYIETVGISPYIEDLTTALEKIDAHEYARIEKKYGNELWSLHRALENNEMDESKYYNVIEKADNEYYGLNGKLGDLLENYFLKIYRDLIEVVDD